MTKVIALAVRLRAPVVVVVAVVVAVAVSVYSSNSKVNQRPCFKTLDSYVTRTGKKVSEGTRKVIREKTATLVAVAHLPYRFVEHQASGSLAMIHINYDVKIDIDTVSNIH